MPLRDSQIPAAFEYVDLYCERTGPGFWNEPFNAFSNIVFFLVAWLAWIRAKRSGCVSNSLSVLILLIVAIGVGSFLFHTLATRWAMAMDVLPILLFKLAFLWIYCKDVLNWKLWSVAGVGIGLLMVSLAGLQYKHLLNGSLLYLPGCLLLVGLGSIHAQRNLAERWSLLVAAGLLLVAIVFRTIDRILCETSVGHGTHYLWHIFAGCVIFYTMKCLIANFADPEAETSNKFVQRFD